MSNHTSLCKCHCAAMCTLGSSRKKNESWFDWIPQEQTHLLNMYSFKCLHVLYLRVHHHHENSL